MKKNWKIFLYLLINQKLFLAVNKKHVHQKNTGETRQIYHRLYYNRYKLIDVEMNRKPDIDSDLNNHNNFQENNLRNYPQQQLNVGEAREYYSYYVKQ